ncbi:prolipoprotein diacylglyceryl transferase [Youngiibacter fragilis]|uniref:Phosphatidylglycerol--prolipoprotein diacylglyceryl transferase n=1 Tax=Youngiibacter fragilis 232.1 TaxID=994573 RepID=V7I8V7_9CLOT|nr:prolipoprotein diacylglyceryl transferase [Youngiibacter fragilis]ETA81701.1 prolipoprotein diacylglyceryl transferase [Youngiibacter fragilis 232.1]
MYNNIVAFGPIVIHGYGLMIAIGIICALFLFEKRASARGCDKNSIYNLSLISLLSGFIGAKLLYCIVEFETIWDNPQLALSGSGFVVYGGIISGIAAAMIYCKRKDLRFLSYFDLAAPSIALAQGVGRIGCFLAGCCYGRETNSAFGIAFKQSLIAPNGVKLIPTQLLSSAGDFMIAAILLLYTQRERKQGQVGALYLILYSTGRFLIEFLRNDNRGYMGLLSTSQFISLIVLFFIAVALFVSNKSKRSMV